MSGQQNDVTPAEDVESVARSIEEIGIVDTHMHLCDLTRLYYSWLQDVPLPHNPAGDTSGIAYKSYSLSDFLADAKPVKVSKIVHIECGLPDGDRLIETDWLQGLADSGVIPMAIVAGATLEHPRVEWLLAAHADRKNVRGVRQIINWHKDPKKTYTPRNLLDSTKWHKGFGLLQKYGLNFDLQLYPRQMERAARLAERHPATEIIVNHAGMPTDRDQPGIRVWERGTKALAKCKNVSIKISGFGGVDPNWSAESIRHFVLHLIDAFGPDRVMFASNFPVDRVHGAYARHFAAFDQATAGFSQADRVKMFRSNAERIYRF